VSTGQCRESQVSTYGNKAKYRTIRVNRMEKEKKRGASNVTGTHTRYSALHPRGKAFQIPKNEGTGGESENFFGGVDLKAASQTGSRSKRERRGDENLQKAS